MAKKRKENIPVEFPEPEKNPEFNPDAIPEEGETDPKEDVTDIIYDENEEETLPSHQIPSPGEGP